MSKFCSTRSANFVLNNCKKVLSTSSKLNNVKLQFFLNLFSIMFNNDEII